MIAFQRLTKLTSVTVISGLFFAVLFYRCNSNTESSTLGGALLDRLFPFPCPSLITNMFGFGTSSANAKDEEWKNAKSIYEFTVKDLDNQDVKLDKYRGKVLLVVNVASKCGFTKSNYKDLNELYSMYHDQGLEILGFPCNQFGHQEPGCEVDIKEFIKGNQVKWDMFGKVDVNGDNAIPLFSWLKSKVKGTLFDIIKWNFTKFLINKEGVPVARYAPNTRPMDFKDAIEAELKS